MKVRISVAFHVLVYCWLNQICMCPTIIRETTNIYELYEMKLWLLLNIIIGVEILAHIIGCSFI